MSQIELSFLITPIWSYKSKDHWNEAPKSYMYRSYRCHIGTGFRYPTLQYMTLHGLVHGF